MDAFSDIGGSMVRGRDMHTKHESVEKRATKNERTYIYFQTCASCMNNIPSHNLVAEQRTNLMNEFFVSMMIVAGGS